MVQFIEYDQILIATPGIDPEDIPSENNDFEDYWVWGEKDDGGDDKKKGKHDKNDD